MKSLTVVTLLLFLFQGCRNNESATAPGEDGPVIDMLNGIVLVSHNNAAATDKGQICIVNPDGSDLRELTKRNDTLSYISATWSPAMDRLAVIWMRQTSPVGSPKKVVTPDETKLVYLGLADAEGRILSVLQKFTTEPAPPVWSPDGSQIAVTSRGANSYPQCFVYGIPGGDSRQITSFDLASGTLTSPIVYAWDANNELSTCVRNYSSGAVWFEFWKMDLAGTLKRRIFEEKGNYLLMPDTYGELTVCSYSRPGGTTGLLAFYDVDSTMQSLREELIDAEYGQSYGNPKLSPDGKSLCFAVRSATETQIYVQDLTTKAERKIYAAPAAVVCDWR